MPEEPVNVSAKAASRKNINVMAYERVVPPEPVSASANTQLSGGVQSVTAVTSTLEPKMFVKISTIVSVSARMTFLWKHQRLL